jgi:serine/threonine protein kinase
MSRALNLLFAVPELRKHVVFPLAVRAPVEGEDDGNYRIIYENVCEDRYTIGTPDRLNNPDLYGLFVNEVSRIVDMVHQAGVLHCDLYPSNIMWRPRRVHLTSYAPSAGCASAAAGAADRTEAGVDVQIIDWDVAHCLYEGDFYDAVKGALREHKPTRDATFGMEHDLKYVNVLKSDMRPGHERYWRDLASGDKSSIDRAFFELFSSSLAFPTNNDSVEKIL